MLYTIRISGEQSESVYSYGKALEYAYIEEVREYMDRKLAPLGILAVEGVVADRLQFDGGIFDTAVINLDKAESLLEMDRRAIKVHRTAGELIEDVRTYGLPIEAFLDLIPY